MFEFSMALNLPLASPDAPNYRPDTWPPQADWPIVLDTSGQVVSRWGDPIWRLDAWAGKCVTLNFGDGPVKKQAAPIDRANANLLRIVSGWWIYGPNGSQGVRSLKARFDRIRPLFALCSKEGILASELNKFPGVADKVPDLIKSRADEFFKLMHELFESRDVLGFALLDRRSISRLASVIPKHETSQTAYIPPRIWNYQVTRLRECLDDFLGHRTQFEECFQFCLDRCDRITDIDKEAKVRKQFLSPSDYQSLSKEKVAFVDISNRFGLTELIGKWINIPFETVSIRELTSYMTLISRVGLAYILNFSLMRVEEAWNLKSDCLQVEHDPKFGDIYLIRGRTTKTATDENAMWVASPAVKVAIEAMKAIALLRNRCPGLTRFALNEKGQFVYYLLDYAFYPWCPGRSKARGELRPGVVSYSALRKTKIFDPQQLRITEKDIEMARLITPTLSDEFQVGRPWPLAWHQLRRTGAVNMQASGLVSDASLQFQLKHVVRAMSLYYGKNYSRLRLEETAGTLYVRTMYETLGREFSRIASDRFVSPHGDKRKADIVRLISVSDEKKSRELAKKGIVTYRKVILGVCMNQAPCPYGGIDNIAHCGGGDSQDQLKPCADVLYDREQKLEIEALRLLLEKRLALADHESPLKASLQAQLRSLESYNYVIQQTDS